MFFRCQVCGWLVLFTAFTRARAESGAGRVVPDFAALASQALTTLPQPPTWDMTQKTTVWTVDDVKAELAKITITPPRVNSLRPTLLCPDHGWVYDFSRWFVWVQKSLKIHFVDELWDCDNYSNCFEAFADMIALKGGETRGALCIGWTTVFYRTAFAGVNAGGGHALVIVGTSKGLFLIEPQNGTMVALGKFPNRDTMVDIFF
jgi:hypothetical protein